MPTSTESPPFFRINNGKRIKKSKEIQRKKKEKKLRRKLRDRNTFWLLSN